MSKESEIERIKFLIRVTKKEIGNLKATAGRLFKEGNQLSEVELQQWVSDSEKSERLDAYAGRYSRLQDTLGDKLLPAILKLKEEQVGPVIENLDKAERFGWLPSVDDWISARKLKNQLVHEYIEDFTILTDALNTSFDQIQMFEIVADKLIDTASEIINSGK